MECTNDVYVMRHIEGQRKMRSEWWNEKVVGVVAEKRRTDTGHREWL